MASLTLCLTLRIETLEAGMAKMSSTLHDYDRHEFIYMPNVNVHDPCQLCEPPASDICYALDGIVYAIRIRPVIASDLVYH